MQGKPYFEVPQYRFYSYPGNSEIYAVSSSDKTTTLMTDTFGDKDITVVEVTAAGASDRIITSSNARLSTLPAYDLAGGWYQ